RRKRFVVPGQRVDQRGVDGPGVEADVGVVDDAGEHTGAVDGDLGLVAGVGTERRRPRHVHPVSIRGRGGQVDAGVTAGDTAGFRGQVQIQRGVRRHRHRVRVDHAPVDGDLHVRPVTDSHDSSVTVYVYPARLCPVCAAITSYDNGAKYTLSAPMPGRHGCG